MAAASGPATLNPIYGFAKVSSAVRRARPQDSARRLRAGRDCGGSTACRASSPREPDGLIQTTALAIEDDRIVAIYVVRNPDKLRHLLAPARPLRSLQ